MDRHITVSDAYSIAYVHMISLNWMHTIILTIPVKNDSLLLSNDGPKSACDTTLIEMSKFDRYPMTTIRQRTCA